MSWYTTEKEAEEACKLKEIKYNMKFIVLKDSEREDCWWAVRKNSVR